MIFCLCNMAKRFTDTDKWKKRLIRGLQAPYKLLWLYVTDDCNHAGIWEVDFEVAQIRVGIEINEQDAIEAFGDKIHVFDDGSKWFIPDFIEFQYGELNPSNRAHASVMVLLNKYKLLSSKGLTSPLQGRKDKDKEKDKDKDKVSAGVLKLTKTSQELVKYMLKEKLYTCKQEKLTDTPKEVLVSEAELEGGSTKDNPLARYLKTTKWIHNTLLEIHGDANKGLNTARLISWCDDVRLMYESDKRTPEDLVAVFNFVKADDFWRSTIQSPAGLRKNYDKIKSKANV